MKLFLSFSLDLVVNMSFPYRLNIFFKPIFCSILLGNISTTELYIENLYTIITVFSRDFFLISLCSLFLLFRIYISSQTEFSILGG